MIRCRCGKRAFRDELAAKIALAESGNRRHTRRPREERRVYQCNRSPWWHLTSEDQRSERNG